MAPAILNMSTYDPSQFPSMTPPAGVTPNFVDPPTRAPATRVVICVTLFLMLLFVCLRIYTRLRVAHAFAADDYLCIVSAACITAFSAVALSIVGNPLGPHQWNIPLTAVTYRYMATYFVTVAMYSLSAMSVKCTLLLFYLRMFRPDRRANIMVWAGIVIIVLFYVISTTLILVDCSPISQQVPSLEPTKWAEQASNSHCAHPGFDVLASQGIFSPITDFYVLAIPVISILALRLQDKRKLGVLAIFLTGLLACACSMAAAYYRWTVRDSKDYSWNSMLPYCLGSAELNIGLICSCLPVVFGMFREVTGSWNSFIRSLRMHSKENVAPGSRRSRRFQKPLNITVKTEMSTYTSLASVDDTYHEQLKRNHFDGYHMNYSTPYRIYDASQHKGSYGQVYQVPQSHITSQSDASYCTTYRPFVESLGDDEAGV
ncbi:hypothetical protein VP1G_08288 [Cytospora mali]|uniref:Rhodopsin domain-containing protein n=1 Tax=Cytospora mali TaxID=578113 RepID=A0A194VBE2_CYTMA|nr:hypothetical protein VP1G_08288 [Valsa mali var. pyri (nom. inval.)]